MKNMISFNRLLLFFVVLIIATTVMSKASENRIPLNMEKMIKLYNSKQASKLNIVLSGNVVLEKKSFESYDVSNGKLFTKRNSDRLIFTPENDGIIIDYDSRLHHVLLYLGGANSKAHLTFGLDDDSTSITYDKFILYAIYDSISEASYTYYIPGDKWKISAGDNVWLEYIQEEPSNFCFITSANLVDHRGFTLGGGIGFVAEKIPMKLELSWAPRIHSSVGLEYIVYPFPNQQWFGIGINTIYFYTGAFGFKSLFVYDGDGPRTIKDPKSIFRSDKFVFTPQVEADIGIGKGWYFEPKLSAFVFGAWPFINGQLGTWHQYYDVSICLSKEW